MMNFLTKDKYRTKIMEHLLHQSSTEQQNTFDSIKEQYDAQKCHQDYEMYNKTAFLKSTIFQKVSQQKPLINDDESTQRKQTQSSKKLRKNNLKDIKETQKQNTQNRNILREPSTSNKKPLQNMPDVRMKGHLKKQSYIFHQKIPIMQVSKTQDNTILQKLKKNLKVKEKNDQKQNIPQNSIQKTGNQLQKEKKYRFMLPHKVSEALNSKKMALQHQDQQLEKENFQNLMIKQINKDDNLFEETQTKRSNQCDETKRSKGSKQMMQFLQSAREKLFQNTDKTPSMKQTIKLKQIEKEKQEDQKENYHNVNDQKEYKSKESNNFKIEIQVSSNKTIQIELSLNSNAKKVAQKFISQNKSQLSSFTEQQIQKLQALLSNKISLQVEKHKKIAQLKKQKESHQKYAKIIDHLGVNQVLLKNFSSGKKTSVSKNKTQRKVSLSKNKKLQFSHVYVENIDTPAINEQDSPIQNKNQIPEESLTFQFEKQITFNPQNQQPFSNQCQYKEVKLAGYLSSPHQLMTYRQQSSEKENKSHSQDQEFYEEHHVDTSHFPLCNETYKNSNRKDANVIDENINNYCYDEFNDQQKSEQKQIGASRILSRSRQKLNKKRSLQNIHLPTNDQQQQNNILTYQEPNRIPLQQKENHQQNIKQQKYKKPKHIINTISSKIVAHLGKENIINSIKEKQLTKRQKILKQKQEKMLQQIKQCSFKPKINNLSKSIDQNKKKKVKIIDFIQKDSPNQLTETKHPAQIKAQTLFIENQSMHHSSLNKILLKLQNSQARFLELYENHKTIESKKQYTRQKSLQQISFRPEINKISKKIIETKRSSLNNSVCLENNSLASSKMSYNRHQSTCKQRSKRNSVQYFNQHLNENQQSKDFSRKRKSLNMSRNIEGLEIGEYLYKQAMKMRKRKESLQNGKIEIFKPLNKSQKIMLNLRERKLSEYFEQLIGLQNFQGNEEENYDFVISPASFDLSQQKFSQTPLKYLIPLLNELQELEVSLNREQFIASGMKLINFLSQDEKADFLGLKKNENRQVQRQFGEPCLNKLSLELIEMKQDYVPDIYKRGLQYKRQIKQKVEYDMQNKVRKQLEKCTFKPQINASQYRFTK